MPTYRITAPYTAKSRPIIFKAEMVRAILDGRKTQTRRVIKAEWSRCLDLEEPKDLQKAIDQCPYGKIGDFLWVRETWATHPFENKIKPSLLLKDTVVYYRADYLNTDKKHFNWRPSIFMPKWVNRITLEITDIRAEKVQELSREDFLAEGIPKYTRARGVLSDNPPDPRWKFIELWDSINAKKGYGWQENPWVWVIEFERIGE